jgi:hypothetical protein
VDGLWFGVFMGAWWLTISQPPQPLLAYGGVCYAVAIVAALLHRLVAKLPAGCLWLVLVPLVRALILVPTSFGSYCIIAALLQLAGWRLGVYGVYLLVLLLNAVVFAVTYFAIAERNDAWLSFIHPSGFRNRL